MLNVICTVIQNEPLGDGIYEMVLNSASVAATALPGQFLHIKINSSLYPLMRRPISIHCVDRNQGRISILYHVRGIGTESLSKMATGSTLDILGPLGKGFPVCKGQRCAVVGGGIGIAPLLELAKELDGGDAYLGFRDHVYKTAEFEKLCASVYVATENGTTGYEGYVTDLLEKNITRYDVVYSCGPKPMLQRVMALCLKNGVECYVSLEERMGCGIGACLVCACKVLGEDGQWHHRKACKDGPVFNAREVVFDD